MMQAPSVRNVIRKFVSTLVLASASALLLAVPSLAQPLNEIVAVKPPQPVPNDGRIEVLEFFAYGCGTCAILEPTLEVWEKRQPKDVNFKRVPAPFPIRGINSVPIFYTLQALGELDRLHSKVFIAVNQQNVNLAVPATRNQWLQANGVDPKKYEEAEKSFSVQTQINRANRMADAYGVTGTPTMVVHGRAATSATGDLTRMMTTVDVLIDRMRDEFLRSKK